MAEIGLILKKTFNLLQAAGSLFSAPARPSVENAHTPFERELLMAFRRTLDEGHHALLVKLVPDEKGDLCHYDPMKDKYVKSTYSFEAIAKNVNPHARMEFLDFEGEPVMMAFDAKEARGIPLQYDGWLAGTIHQPSAFYDRPVIALLPREQYEYKMNYAEKFDFGVKLSIGGVPVRFTP